MYRTSIRRRLMLSILAGCIIPFVIGFLVIQTQTENWLFAQSIAHSQEVLRLAAGHVDESVIGNMKRLTALTASDARLVSGAGRITSYVNFSPDLLTQARSPEETALTDFFRSIVETQDIIAFLSYGTEQGGYVEYPPFAPETSYDPRSRDWYRSALIHEGTRVSEPYETSVTKDLVISIDKVVRSEDRVVGVVSLTIGLENIMHHISGIRLGGTGAIFLFSPSGKVLLAPEHPDWLMQNASALDTDIFRDLGARTDGYFEGNLDGTDQILSLHTSPVSGWKFVAVEERQEVLLQSGALSGLLAAVFLVLSVVIGLILFWISARITHPINALTRRIKQMARFDFTEETQPSDKGFRSGNDELTEITVALDEMQSSFLELRDSLDTVDTQIRTIRVEEHEVHRILLSENNPLRGIATSVNGLLEKVSEYLGRIDFLADHDPLTNLPNRRSFHRQLSHALTSGQSGAVIMLDMDNFKAINDTMGHVYGDRLLQRIAEKLAGLAGNQDFVSRFGGDEFLLLHVNRNKAESLPDFIDQLRGLFDEPILLEGLSLPVEFSMGIVRFPDNSSDYEQIIMYADMAMYDVKRAGKNTYAFFDEKMAAHVRFRLEMKRLLLNALENDGFFMVYQPQVRLSDGQVIGYEALLRLRTREASPAQFIPIAEEDNLIIPIGRAVVRLVIEQISRWRASGIPSVPVSINFSALQIDDEGFRTYVEALLATHQLSHDAIHLEITEHIFLENKQAAVKFLNEMRESGFRIAVDDFGSEYSSLSYLTTLPIETLKFDRELNLRLLNRYDDAIMRNLISFVHSLNLTVIAEGVEEEDHVRRLVDCGCDAVQGYWFSPPLEADTIETDAPKCYPLPG